MTAFNSLWALSRAHDVGGTMKYEKYKLREVNATFLRNNASPTKLISRVVRWERNTKLTINFQNQLFFHIWQLCFKARVPAQTLQGTAKQKRARSFT
jgi:hypothetical protein